jgi:predicted naringenin-chalcone synthase
MLTKTHQEKAIEAIGKRTIGVIAAIGTQVATHSFKQEEVAQYMSNLYADSTASRKLNILSRQSGINYRQSVIPDFSLNCMKPELFVAGDVPNVEQRMNVYKDKVLPLAAAAIDKAITKIGDSELLEKVTHIITVTCTGMYAPGLGIELINHYNLPDTTFHTAINFMGCNASFAALRMADLIQQSNPNALTLVVCVELCTLHFQPKDNNDNFLANTLFADGAAAIVVASAGYADQHKINSVELKGFQTLTLSEGADLMAWNINAVNFEMVLSSMIPDFIGKNVKYIVKEISESFKLSKTDHIKWAIHPGGKKILDAFCREMNLNQEDIAESYQILRQHGNMSSVTIIFVLEELLKNSTTNDQIIAVGFGPGISVETAFLQTRSIEP